LLAAAADLIRTKAEFTAEEAALAAAIFDQVYQPPSYSYRRVTVNRKRVHQP
jgi:hypothetical protein